MELLFKNGFIKVKDNYDIFKIFIKEIYFTYHIWEKAWIFFLHNNMNKSQQKCGAHGWESYPNTLKNYVWPSNIAFSIWEALPNRA